MAAPKLVEIPRHRIGRFKPLLGDGYGAIEEAAARASGVFQGRTNWHVSSTMFGGGVAEMLHALLPYVVDAGIDARWVVLQERPEFFELTKRLHNHLHAAGGDGGPLGAEERELYERTLASSAQELIPLFREGDVVFFHDPQTAGLIPAAKQAGATVVWRCHVGTERPDGRTRRAWEFLAPYVSAADAYVFSRLEYVWGALDPKRAWVLAPCIDPFSPKNQELDGATVEAIVGAVGLGPASDAAASYTRSDGSAGRVVRRGEILQDEPLPPGAKTVAQISRWDRLKDHIGLLACFERHLPAGEPHLLLVGPSPASVADDPEGAAVWNELGQAWRELESADFRRRVHIVSLAMDDLDENAAMVNALQRRADVVVQKSLAEGFGLTVAEGMWKRRPVIGSRVGGIQDQIVDGVSGVLIDDPRDLDAFGSAIAELSGDPIRAAELGEQARQRVFDHFLGPNRLVEYLELVAGMGPGDAR